MPESLGKIYVYYHKDFDGIASAYLIFHILKQMDYDPEIVSYVDYDMFEDEKEKEQWFQGKSEIRKPACFVDFPLYRPDILIYFDHHPFNNRLEPSVNTKIYEVDTSKPCCFDVILEFAKKNFINISGLKNLQEIGKWARILDKAEYFENNISPSELLKPTIPAIIVGKAMFHKECIELILEKMIQGWNLDRIAELNVIKEAFQEDVKNINERLGRLRKVTKYATPEHEKLKLVTYDSSDIGWERSAPFYFFQDCDVAIGICWYAGEDIYYVKASRNPWKESSLALMDKVKLGEIFKKFGGGGHNYVASAKFNSREEALEVMDKIVKEVEKKLQN
jgi:hypothetical protein